MVRMKFELSKLISLLPGNIWWKDIHGHFMGCNNNVAKLLGYKSVDEIVGFTNRDLFEPEIAAILDKTDNIVFSERREMEIEEIGVDENNQQAIYITRKLPLIDDEGQLVGLLGVSLDITDRKARERELAIAKEKAEVANNAKSSFIMNISHDIRTPLNGIIGFSRIIESKETDVVKKEWLGYIVESSERLAGYLNDVINVITTKDQFQVNKEAFSLHQIIHMLVQMFSAEIASHQGIKLVLDLDPNMPETIFNDRFRIEKIILNLVSNAFKFTHEGEITISTKLLKRAADQAAISIKVSDTGVGIAKEDQEKIFGRFTRLEPSYTNKYSGYGLGLYIVKTFVDELEGTINLQSELGQGTTFELIFNSDSD